MKQPKTPRPSAPSAVKPRGRNGGRKPLVAGGSNAWLRLRIPSAELDAIKAAAKAADKDLSKYVRETLQKP